MNYSWHSMPLNKVASTLNTNLTNGLSDLEIKKRVEHYGLNEIKEPKEDSFFRIFLRQFKSLVVYALLLAVALSMAMHEFVDAVVIALILFVNAILGAVQEQKAEKAIKALKKLSATKAIVIRDGRQELINAINLVPGDIILLEVGDKVPADARIIHETAFSINESMLTGESVPSKKCACEVEEKTLVAQRKNMVYKDTIITSGKAKCIVVSTGIETEIGKIADTLINTVDEKSPLQVRMDKFLVLLGKAVMVGAALIIILGLFVEELTFTETVKLAIAQAVSFIPEGLPIVVTVVLAVGISAMARKKAIVRKISAVETLGSVTVICTDKTGTLTKNEMTVKQIYFNNELIEVTGEGYDTIGEFKLGGITKKAKEIQGFQELIKTAVLCNNASIQKEKNNSIVGDPTEGALLILGEKTGSIKKTEEEKFERVGEILFDQEKKFMATFNLDKQTKIAHVKGAPENVVEMCSKIMINGKEKTLDAKTKKIILEEAKKMASDALRVLGFAQKKTKSVSEKELSEMTFLGLTGMLDPARIEAAKSISDCKKAGIRVVMITGDHKNTAQAIAQKVGLIEKHSLVISGEELDEMNEYELEKIVEEVSVYARASSQHKMRIINALQKKGHIVAMTGDGINDALAVKKADVGISMGISGTEVTKEASDLILEDDNFSTIAEAVREGRNAYENVKKVVSYLLGTNISEVIIILFILCTGLIFPVALPIILIPIQILWINLVTDGACVIALGMDKEQKDTMLQKPRNPKEALLTKEMIYFILVTAIISTIGTLVLFYYDYGIANNSIEHARTIAFIVLILFQIFSVYNVRSHKPFVYSKVMRNPYLLLSVVASLVLLPIIVYLPIFNIALQTVPLTRIDWILIVGIAALLPLLFEAKKALFGLREHVKHKKNTI